MKKRIHRIIIYVSLIGILIYPVYAQKDNTENEAIKKKVEEAFKLMEADSYLWNEGLKPYGKKVIPYLATYFESADTTRASQVLAFLGTIKEPETIPLLLRLLNGNYETLTIESKPYLSENAGVYLYDNFSPQMLGHRDDVRKALIDNLTSSNATLTTVMLAGYFPGEDMEKALLAVKTDRKFGYISKKDDCFVGDIKITVPTYLSLYRINPDKYRDSLLQRAAKTDIDNLGLLLCSVKYIEDKQLLKTVFEKGIKINDILYTEIGIEGQILPNSARIKDFTIFKFAEKFQINLGTKVDYVVRYSPHKINSVTRNIRQKLNSL